MSLPERPPIDRTKPPYKDDPVIARLTDEQVWALAAVLLRFAESEARRIAESWLTAEAYFSQAEQSAEAER